jgi:hypothetical protein
MSARLNSERDASRRRFVEDCRLGWSWCRLKVIEQGRECSALVGCLQVTGEGGDNFNAGVAARGRPRRRRPRAAHARAPLRLSDLFMSFLPLSIGRSSFFVDPAPMPRWVSHHTFDSKCS